MQTNDYITIETEKLTIFLFNNLDCLEAHCYFNVSKNIKQNKFIKVTDTISMTAKELRRKPLFIMKVKKNSAYCEEYNINFCYLIHNVRITLLDLLKWKEYL